jgi:mannosyltransferase
VSPASGAMTAARASGAPWQTRATWLAREHWRTVLVASLLFAVALGVGLYRIGHKSIWYDEAISISFARAPLGTAWAAVAGRTDGPLHYFALWGWVHLFGIGEGAVRSLSALFAAGTVATLYLLGRRLFGVLVGVGAALLLTVQGFFVEYAQEARSYAMAMLLATVSTYLLLRATDSSRRSWWFSYAVVLAAGIYAHLFVALVGLAHVAWLILGHRRQLPAALPAFALTAVLSAPLLAAVLLRPGPIWMSMLTVDSARYVLTEMVSGGWPVADLFEGIVVLGIVLAITRRDTRLTLVLAWLLVPIFVMFAMATLRPLISPRYVLVSLPALALVASATVFALRNPSLRAFLYATAIGASLFGLASWYTAEPKPNWRAATQFVSQSSSADDALVFYPPRVRIPFDYYVDRLELATPPVAEGDPGRVDTVWLVMNYQPRVSNPLELSNLIALLEETHVPVAEPRDFNNVRVQQWEPKH